MKNFKCIVCGSEELYYEKWINSKTPIRFNPYSYRIEQTVVDKKKCLEAYSCYQCENGHKLYLDDKLVANDWELNNYLSEKEFERNELEIKAKDETYYEQAIDICSDSGDMERKDDNETAQEEEVSPLKVLQLKEYSYQLEDGLWYEDMETCWGGVCPKCGEGNITNYQIGRSHWPACIPCRVRWHLGDNLISGWKEMPDEDPEDGIDSNIEILKYFEDADDIYAASPLKMTNGQYEKLLKEVSLQRQKLRQSASNCEHIQERLDESESNHETQKGA